MGFKQSLWVLVILIAMSSVCEAKVLCLYARSNNDPMSGHAFVTLEQGDQVLERYGMWPDSKLAENDQILIGNVALNKNGDYPLSILRKKFKVSDNLANMTEAQICEDVGNIKASVIRQIAIEVGEKRYQSLSNNCTHFAIRLFNAVTGADFPSYATPKRSKKEMLKRGWPLVYSEQE